MSKRQNPPNARFWISWRGEWCKITLRPGQEITLTAGGPTDEGWYQEVDSYRYDAAEGVIYSGITHDSQDCDGRHGWRKDFECPVSRLKALEADVVELSFDPKDNYERPERPDWQPEGHAVCYDEFAEAAGY